MSLIVRMKLKFSSYLSERYLLSDSFLPHILIVPSRDELTRRLVRRGLEGRENVIERQREKEIERQRQREGEERDRDSNRNKLRVKK